MRLGMWLLATTLLISACGSTEPSVSVDQMWDEYTRSDDVKNDGQLSQILVDSDMADLATAGTNSDSFFRLLLGTFDCGDQDPTSDAESNPCELNSAVTEAARTFAGPNAKPLGRSVVVKYADGSLEVLTLYVVRGTERTVVIDRNGQTYTDLEDFRANNELLTSDDTMLTLRDITSIPAEGEAVTVTGHTPPVWPRWLFGGIGVAVLLGAAIYILYRRVEARADARFTATLDAEESAVEKRDQ